MGVPFEVVLFTTMLSGIRKAPSSLLYKVPGGRVPASSQELDNRCLVPRSPEILTLKPCEYGGSRTIPVRCSATTLQDSENAATQPTSVTMDSVRPSVFCTAAPPLHQRIVRRVGSALSGQNERNGGTAV